MTKIFWNCLKISPVIAATLFTASSALAGDVSEQMTQVSQLEQQGNAELAQGTSVSRLSDVNPTDWAFQALQSLTERYNCIAGYPDGTFKGKRSLTRYEFAAALNACLNQVNEVIATSTADLVNKQDLATLQRLQEEFRAELATLRGRVDALESRTSFLEAHQFSTTTKLKGEAIFALSDSFGDLVATGANHTPYSTAYSGKAGVPSSTNSITSNAVFTDRVRLSLNSSFTGTDLLQTRLQAINTLPNNGITGTNQTRLGFDGNDPGNSSSDNAVYVDKLNYSYKFGDKARIKIDATGAELYENVNTFNPDFTASGTGALSRYGRFSPIYRIPGKYTDNAGITLVAHVGKPITVSAAYFGGG
jgi:BMFP domain-containing protein YqiC